MRRVSKSSAKVVVKRESAMDCCECVEAHLLHDPSLTFRKGDVPSRFVLDEFDVNLPPLTARLVIVIIIIVCSSTHARPLNAASIGAVAIVGRVEPRRMGVWIGDVGHEDCDDGVARQWVQRTCYDLAVTSMLIEAFGDPNQDVLTRN